MLIVNENAEIFEAKANTKSNCNYLKLPQVLKNSQINDCSLD